MGTRAKMKEVVILVGRQGAGKTRYCQTALSVHTRVSQDEGPRQFERLFRRYRRRLDQGVERIVIDRTNPARRQRKLFADAARAHGYRVKIIHFNAPRDVCEKRIVQRAGHPTLTPEKMRHAIDGYERQLDIPTEEECDELVVIGEDQSESR